jgi:hypothetical protein
MIKKYILSFLIASSLLGGCSKFIDVEPTHDLDGEKFFKNLDDIEYELVGTYARLRSSSWFGDDTNPFLSLPDMISDNLYETIYSLRNFTTHIRWAITEDDTRITNVWTAGYNVILNANIVLNKIESLASENPERANRLKAQAYVLRAMAHFDLMRYFADNYDRNSTALGVPYTKSIDKFNKPPRITVKEDYDMIYADLNEAMNLFQNMDRDINVGGGRAFIDEFVAKALLARISLYNKSYVDAINYATDVIDEFPIANRATYPQIWTDATLNEVIWSYTFNAGEGRIAGNIYWAPNDRLSFTVSKALEATYDKVNDIRYSTFYIENYRPNVTGFKKHLAKQAMITKPDGVVNYKVFRTSEMYLIRAEAKLKQPTPDPAGALDDLDEVRMARINGFTSGGETGAALEDAIALERRKELIAEGHRFFDLKRTVRTINRDNCSVACTLASNNRAWTWPIPTAEILANPNIGNQNPGY